MPDSFASLASRIEAAIERAAWSLDSNQFDREYSDDARAALAEMKERAKKLEAVADEARWVVENGYDHGSSLKEALAALSSPETE